MPLQSLVVNAANALDISRKLGAALDKPSIVMNATVLPSCMPATNTSAEVLQQLAEDQDSGVDDDHEWLSHRNVQTTSPPNLAWTVRHDGTTYCAV